MNSNEKEIDIYAIAESIYLNVIFGNFNYLLNQYENNYLLDIMNIYNNTTFQILQDYYNENKNLKNLFNKATNADKILIIMILCVSVDWKLEREYYVVNEMKSITKKHIDKLFPKNNNYEPSEEISSHIDTIFTDPNYKENYIHEERAGYIVYQGAYEKDNSFTINKVIPNFAQPLRMFNTMSISINPSLPLNDILSFVKKIKEDYDKKCDFKNFFEFSLEDLIVDSDTKSTIDDIPSYDKKKWADMFYIYDYFQFYFSEGNKINKGKTENNKKNKEEDLTTVAKEVCLQLSFYHILKYKKPLDFSEFADIGNYKSAYNKYEMDLFFEIKEKIKEIEVIKEKIKEIQGIKDKIKEIEENKEKIKEIKEIKKYIKLKKSKNGKKEETVNFYMTANHIKTDYYPKMRKFIEGKNPEYIKLVDGRNHTKNSFIDGKNNTSSKL